MSRITKTIIGIQARSTSNRLPGKVMEYVGEKTVLQMVLDAALGASHYLNRWADSKKSFTEVVLLIPHGDPIKQAYESQCTIVEGPEDDVLTRYAIMADKFDPDYIVRITADCPLIPQFIISKSVTIAMMNRYDYVSNVDEKCRTTPDGLDCEVISKKLLKHVHQTATTAFDREHVTTLVRSNPPRWATRGTIINYIDQSALKISVDTLEDLEAVRRLNDQVSSKLEAAKKIYGKTNVHRI